MSSRTRSGFKHSIISIACVPVSASPTISKSPIADTIWRKRFLEGASSSTINTLTMQGPRTDFVAHGGRHLDDDTGFTAIGFPRQFETVAVIAFQPFRYVTQSVAGAIQ